MKNCNCNCNNGDSTIDLISKDLSRVNNRVNNLELEYVEPTWTNIRNKPALFPTNIDNVTGLNDALENLVETREADLVITVGETGAYRTINEALAAASKIETAYKAEGVRIDILLLSGFVMEEQVFIHQKNMGFVTIKSEDPEVVIRRSALTLVPNVNGWRTGTFPAFTAMENSVLPALEVLFNMDSTGTSTGRGGILLKDNSFAVMHRNSGFKNVPWRALYLDNGFCYARRTIWENNGTEEGGGDEDNGTCVRVANNSLLNIRDSIFTNNKRAIAVATGTVVAGYCTFDGGTVGDVGISAQTGVVGVSYSTYNNYDRTIYAGNQSTWVNCQNSTFGSNIRRVLDVSGGKVNAENCTFQGSTEVIVSARSYARVCLNNSTLTGSPIAIAANQFSDIFAQGTTITGIYSPLIANTGSTIHACNAILESTGTRYALVTGDSYINLSFARKPDASNITNDLVSFNHKTKDGLITYDIDNYLETSSTNLLTTASTPPNIAHTTSFASDRIIRLASIVGRFRIFRRSTAISATGTNYILNINQNSDSTTKATLYAGEWVEVINDSASSPNWRVIAKGVDNITSGTTSERPRGVRPGYTYYDTTLSLPIIWNGTNWVNYTGATV